MATASAADGPARSGSPDDRKRATRALQALTFLMADMQAGIGPFLGVFLQQRGWSSGPIGTVMTAGGVAGMVMTVPAGALIDHIEKKRLVVVVTGICTVIADMHRSVTWIHVGDHLHMDEADGWASRDRLVAIVGEGNARIGAAADLRMVTRPADPTQVPRPGEVEIVAKLFGHAGEPVASTIDDGAATAMAALGDPFWSASVPLGDGLHHAGVTAGADRETIRVLVPPVDTSPHRGLPIAPGRDIHAIGAWPEHDSEGTQLGPNKNGARP